MFSFAGQRTLKELKYETKYSQDLYMNLCKCYVHTVFAKYALTILHITSPLVLFDHQMEIHGNMNS